MHVTVILCTYNRDQTLGQALSSVAASIMPESVAWDVLIVDNNSTDKTKEVALAFCREHPNRFRYVFEAQPGKSFALNSAVRQARGDILAFTDDDVTVDSMWLQNLTHALENGQWSGAGGRILLEWPKSLPKWLTTDGPYARHGFPGFDQGLQCKRLSGPPFGANMAFRREMFSKHGWFRTDLGPNPQNQLHNEDTEFGRRLIAAAEPLRYEPDAVVQHPVPEDKLKRSNILKWWYNNGRGFTREFDVQPAPIFFRIVWWILLWSVTVDARLRFYRELVIVEKCGMLSEHFRLWLAAKRQKGSRMRESTDHLSKASN
jgi:glycosyltransferase involved in cell wall biosynthesis